ncbi:hypothetical protein N7493_003944 [Penicillium malachiteum]|uniref:Xylanolytic transcriptional activator regulatory domain-containing protein n=1 Tax=Penicillium malachiteum TaxID=1324776 RepID=A0AAD6HQN2_9EURO|nr:hypothetical protein N7493_003944 [Penicillium malachiteum]
MEVKTPETQQTEVETNAHTALQLEIHTAAATAQYVDPHDQSLSRLIDLQTDQVSEVHNVRQVEVPSRDLVSSDAAQPFFEDSIHDLNILWGGMSGNFALEDSFSLGFTFPFGLGTAPGLDLSEQTYLSFSGPSTSGASGETIPDNHHSDDDASLCNYQLPPLNQNDGYNSQDVENVSERPNTPVERPGGSETNYPWRIGKDDYNYIISEIENFRHILPDGFIFPSKYVFCRYIEGFFTGSHGHLPFLHLPTVSVASLTPSLILAIIAMGAQYRFETDRAACYFKASKSLIDNHSCAPKSSNSGFNPGSDAGTFDSARKVEFEVLQTQIILSTLGIWGHHNLLHDSLSMTANLSQSLRTSGTCLQEDNSDSESWQTWVQKEGRRRTAFIAHMLSNNQTILYDVPPKILSSELKSLYLPWPEELWKASSATEWKTLRSKWPHSVSFGDAYTQLFRSKNNRRKRTRLSSFGNLVLVHGIFQHIFFAWESEFCMSQQENSVSLPDESLSKFHTALRRWQRSWETSSDPSITPSSPKGPLGFNATAIFRIACIRLHLNLGPHRCLSTWKPEIIAHAFLNAPQPTQSPLVYHAILQSIHALSIPVRLGVEYVARTQTLTWSTIHSLCNLECAIFLCKWLETLAMNPTDLHNDTKKLLRIITSVLREADLLVPNINMEFIKSSDLRQIGAVLVRLLSRILKGTHVFEMMHVFCEALRIYADLLESNI